MTFEEYGGVSNPKLSPTSKKSAFTEKHPIL